MRERSTAQLGSKRIQLRTRVVDANDLWRIVVLRGLGHSELEIATELGKSGKTLSQSAVSYQLSRLRRLSPDEQSQYRVLAALLMSSSTAMPYLMLAIVDSARQRRRR